MGNLREGVATGHSGPVWQIEGGAPQGGVGREAWGVDRGANHGPRLTADGRYYLRYIFEDLVIARRLR